MAAARKKHSTKKKATTKTSAAKKQAARGTQGGGANAAQADVDPALKRRARRIYKKLEARYPDAHCALIHRNPFELLIATILSAQCTDVMVNKVTPELFKRYPDAASLSRAKQSDVETLIKSTGFFRNKAKSIIGAATGIVDDFEGQVPRTMDKLLTLPGVARKTANVVLGNAFDINVGVVVDTHVKRIANRMALTEETDPQKVERDLMPLFPKKNWTMLSHLLIHHGRDLCPARKPQCDACPVRKDCPQVGVA